MLTHSHTHTHLSPLTHISHTLTPHTHAHTCSHTCSHSPHTCSHSPLTHTSHTHLSHTCSHSGCYLGVYAGLGFSQAFFVLFSSFTLAYAGIFASRTLHSRMLKNILRSPMSFFDTTPTGRILNRFSKDIYMIDEVIPRSLQGFLFTLFSVMSIIIVIMIATPIFGVVIIPLGLFYVLVQVRWYVYIYCVTAVVE